MTQEQVKNVLQSTKKSSFFSPFESQLLYGVCNAKINDYPYPHFYVESIFSERSYTLLEENWPLPQEMKSIADSGWVTPGSFKERLYHDVSDEAMLSKVSGKRRSVWQDFATTICSDYIINRLVAICQPYHHLHPWLSKGGNFKVKPSILVQSDYNDYTISPHSQHPQEIMVLLIYFAKKENTEEAGTSMYIPRDPNFECDGLKHHQPESFHKILTAPFRRNSLFGFLKTRNSFHGVEPVDQPTERNVLYIGIVLEPN